MPPKFSPWICQFKLQLGSVLGGIVQYGVNGFCIFRNVLQKVVFGRRDRLGRLLLCYFGLLFCIGKRRNLRANAGDMGDIFRCAGKLFNTLLSAAGSKRL